MPLAANSQAEALGPMMGLYRGAFLIHFYSNDGTAHLTYSLPANLIAEL